MALYGVLMSTAENKDVERALSWQPAVFDSGSPGQVSSALTTSTCPLHTSLLCHAFYVCKMRKILPNITLFYWMKCIADLKCLNEVLHRKVDNKDLWLPGHM